MAEDSDSKTEQPTNRKLSRAHDDGDVLQSNEVKTAAVIVAGLALVWFMAGPMMSRIERILQAFYAQADTIRLDTVESYTAFLSKIFSDLVLVLLLPFGMFVLVALAATTLQTGLIFSTQKLGFNFERLSPLAGLKRMFSQQSIVDLVKNILKLAVVGAIAVLIVYPHFKSMPSLPLFDCRSFSNSCIPCWCGC